MIDKNKIIEDVKSFLQKNASLVKSKIWGGNVFIFQDKESFVLNIKKFDELRKLPYIEDVIIKYDTDESLISIGIYFIEEED